MVLAYLFYLSLSYFIKLIPLLFGSYEKQGVTLTKTYTEHLKQKMGQTYKVKKDLLILRKTY